VHLAPVPVAVAPSPALYCSLGVWPDRFISLYPAKQVCFFLVGFRSPCRCMCKCMCTLLAVIRGVPPSPSPSCNHTRFSVPTMCKFFFFFFFSLLEAPCQDLVITFLLSGQETGGGRCKEDVLLPVLQLSGEHLQGLSSLLSPEGSVLPCWHLGGVLGTPPPLGQPSRPCPRAGLPAQVRSGAARAAPTEVFRLYLKDTSSHPTSYAGTVFVSVIRVTSVAISTWLG
jgi:hypothetical protein